MNTSVTKLSDIKRRDKNGHIYTINAEVVKKVLKKKGKLYKPSECLYPNPNIYIVDDKNWKISIAILTNNNIENILTKENELEKLNITLNECKKDKKFNTVDNVAAEILNFSSLCGAIFIALVLNTVSLPVSILLATFIYFLIKIPNILIYGTRIGRFKKRKNFKKNIEQIETQIPELQKQLEELKKEANYEKIPFSEIENEINNEIYIQQNNNDLNTITEQKTNEKVFKIGQKKNN